MIISASGGTESGLQACPHTNFTTMLSSWCKHILLVDNLSKKRELTHKVGVGACPIMFYIYILKSLKDKNLYIGSTNNLERRLKEHNNGKCFSTKHRTPLEIIYYEAYKSESDARRRERNLKLRSRAHAQLKKRIEGSLK